MFRPCCKQLLLSCLALAVASLFLTGCLATDGPGPFVGPTGLTVTSAATGQVTIQWTAMSQAIGYNVYYSTTPGVTPVNTTKAGSTSATTPTYTQSGLTNGTTYFFVVTAIVEGYETSVSNQIAYTPIATTTTLTKFVPTQYLAKLYTEALGRAPDQIGWKNFVAALTSGGCSVRQLAFLGIDSGAFFDSREFLAANPDPQSQVIALYRAILNRDPDATGFSTNYAALVAGASIESVAYSLYTSTEFATLANAICGVGQTTYNPDYSFGTTPAFYTTPLSSGITNYSDLTNALTTAGAAYISTQQQQTVTLAQAALIPIPATLTIPSGVTLQTYGNPLPSNYTQMARLVRVTAFPSQVVWVNGGAILQNIWIDGQSSILGFAQEANVETLGGTGTKILNNKSSAPLGGSNFLSLGVTTGNTCINQTISGNLLTGYTTQHGYSSTANADGMTMYCENLTISNNSIVDMSDIGIVIMGTAVSGTTQASTVTNNTIISAGVSTNAPIGVDQITGHLLTGVVDSNGNNTPGTGQQLPCFAGTVFSGNTFWTGQYTTFDFGLMLGARPWFASPRLHDSTCTGAQNGLGPSFTNNGTGMLSANVKEGIEVDGFMNVTVTNDGTNALNVTPSSTLFPSGVPAHGCPVTNVEMQAGDSGGSVYLTTTSTAIIDGCI